MQKIISAPFRQIIFNKLEKYSMLQFNHYEGVFQNHNISVSISSVNSAFLGIKETFR